MSLPRISLDHDGLANFEASIRKEWLVTNGLGGYASSTILGVNTRKYHGLLVAALKPPGDRRVFLSKLDEEIDVENKFFPLGANEFREAIFPQGYRCLREFSISPFPKYAYEAGKIEVDKTIFMPHAKNGVVVIYNVVNSDTSDLNFRVFPLVTWRHFHTIVDRWKTPVEFSQQQEGKLVEMIFKLPASTMELAVTDGRFVAKQNWIERLFFREEAERGESCVDDEFQPGFFEVSVKAGKRRDFAVVAVADERVDAARKLLTEMPATAYDAMMMFDAEMKRCLKLVSTFYEKNRSALAYDWLSWLVLAADSFLVKVQGQEQRAVIAGYHWFESWGRDTFVSLPGLTLVTARFDDAKKVFVSYERHLKGGLIPNMLSDESGQPFYNSVDASLWYVDAVLQYLKYTGDFDFVKKQLWKSLRSIVDGYVKGTAHGIRVDGDGLVSHGPQLTWMDAAVDGKPVTPREGKAVEIQALWYNALRTMQLLAMRFGEEGEAERYGFMAEKAKKSFSEKFWNAERGCLFDVIDMSGSDGSLRPNQIFTVSLDFSILDDVQCGKIVDVVQRELLTPFSLRTLNKKDPRYVGVYAGDRVQRDVAYHNGSVWPWLLGSFVRAFLKSRGTEQFRREFAWKNFLAPLFTEQVYRGGLGTVSEVFDGDAPHCPRGCVAQAWSVAELLRTYVEDVMLVRPQYEKEVVKL